MLRRHRRIVLASIVVVLSAGVSARSAELPDWALFRIEVGAEPWEGSIEGELRVETLEGSPLVGLLIATPTGTGGTVIELGGDPLSVTTTSSLGGIHYELQPGDQGPFVIGFSIQLQESLQSGDEVALLTAAAGGVIQSWTIGLPEAIPEDVTLEVGTGIGTRALETVEPTDSGLAVKAGISSVGFSSTHETVASGVIGAFAPRACTRCRVHWMRPDGVEGEAWLQKIDLGLIGMHSPAPIFAGPPGGWSWDWLGFAMRDVAQAGGVTGYGLYAPVGEAFRSFDRA